MRKVELHALDRIEVARMAVAEQIACGFPVRRLERESGAQGRDLPTVYPVEHGDGIPFFELGLPEVPIRVDLPSRPLLVHEQECIPHIVVHPQGSGRARGRRAVPTGTMEDEFKLLVAATQIYFVVTDTALRLSC